MQLSLFDDLYTEPSDRFAELTLLRGSGVVDGKKRIHAYVLTNPSPDQLAKFLQNEYGIGGFCGKEKPGYIDRESHDAKGITYEGTDNEGNVVSGEMNWHKAAKLIIDMVHKGSYKGE